MQTVLDQIVAAKQQELELLQQQTSLSAFTDSPLFGRQTLSLKAFVEAQDFGIIAEIKRKSPSAGEITGEIDPVAIARSYEAQGAAGISVLTDFPYFGGSINDIQAIRPEVNIPILRKEFIIDELQLFEAKAAGADAVLLIAAILEKERALQLTIIAKSLGLEVLFEVHAISELEKINDEIDLIAVNNRNLHTQQTSLQHSFNLAPYLPSFAPAISASGIRSAEDITALKEAGFSGGLVGESILRNGHLHTLTQLEASRS